MSNETKITVIGNLAGDPELRFISSGVAVVNFTIASTPRTFDKTANEWKDGETLFMRCSLWRDAAENVAESLTKGMRVIATGNLVSRSWESNGEKRSVMEMQVDEVGPSLMRATAKVTRNERRTSAPAAAAASHGYAPSAAGGSAGDPWASAPMSEEPPF